MSITAETFHLNVPEHLKWLRGCDHCTHGRTYAVDPKTVRRRYPDHLTGPELQLFEWRDGVWTPCTHCDAGAVAQRQLETTAAQMETLNAQVRDLIDGAAQRRLDKLFANAQVPARFASLTFKSFHDLAANDPGKAEAIKRIREYYADNRCQTPTGARDGILLYGRSDMGKTGALSPLFVSKVRAGVAGLWVQYNDLLAALRDFESGQVQERIKAAQHAELLFIDDFGDPAADRAATDYTRDVIFRILDHRNNYHLPTLVTSNLSPTQMQSQFHERTVKRLNEMCVIVEVGGTPMRGLVASAESAQRAGVRELA